MLVKAIKGGKYPVYGKPGQYIGDSKAVEVPNNSYYRRAVSRGSLVIVSPPVEKKRKKAKKEVKS